MILVFEERYSGWPLGAKWVACVEREDVDLVEQYIEELIDDCCSPGDCYASDASDEIRRRCWLAGGETPVEAVSNLMAMEEAQSSIYW